VQTMR